MHIILSLILFLLCNKDYSELVWFQKLKRSLTTIAEDLTNILD